MADAPENNPGSALKFDELDLPAPLLRAVEDLGFENATPIQEQALPVSLKGLDVAGQAQTGTGKTACFLLGTLKRLLMSERPSDGSPRALVVAPTRELAMQIAADGEELARHTDLGIALAYGGTNWRKQAAAIEEGVDIVVGTPGRLIDYVKRGVLKLRRVQVVVIDEADRMFDMGFIMDLTYLMRCIPPRDRRQAMLFSATLDYRVMRLARQYMNDPVEVKIEPDKLVVERIVEELYHVSSDTKVELLLGLMAREDLGRSMIFVNRKVDGESLAWRLNGNGHEAVYLSGDLPQRKRTAIIKALKEGEIRMLVATDVASRGLHVEGVTHVFNFDVPQDPEDYVHRIGRTARAGAEGKAITLACDNYAYCLSALEEYLKRKVPVVFPQEDLSVPDKSRPFRRRRGDPYTGWSRGGQQKDSGGSKDSGGAGEKSKKRRRRSKPKKQDEAAMPAQSGAQTTAQPKPPAAARSTARAKGGDASAAGKGANKGAPQSKRPRRARRRIGDGGGLSGPTAVSKASDASAPEAS